MHKTAHSPDDKIITGHPGQRRHNKAYDFSAIRLLTLMESPIFIQNETVDTP
jgi:hypothetical protein